MKDLLTRIGAKIPTLGKGVSYVLIGVLLIALLLVSKCKKECDTSALEAANDELLTQIDSLNTVNHTLVNRPAEVQTITETKTVFKDHTTFVKNWEELQRHKALLNAQIQENNRVWATLDKTQEQFDSLLEAQGSFVFSGFQVVEEPPIISTRTDEKTDEYEIIGSIVSKDSLISWERSVQVHPRTITLTKVEKEYLKKHNFLALKVGALYLDRLNNIHYTPSLEYGYKWFVLEAGPVLDKDFKFEGIETKAGFVIKF